MGKEHEEKIPVIIKIEIGMQCVWIMDIGTGIQVQIMLNIWIKIIELNSDSFKNRWDDIFFLNQFQDAIILAPHIDIFAQEGVRFLVPTGIEGEIVRVVRFVLAQLLVAEQIRLYILYWSCNRKCYRDCCIL